ncbi:hypothetical protein [Aeromonas jandaei]|uniref:hypothetical protein n=1 Tax=Aeromonas jandaei TaxID=650 RepID=UPI002B05FD5C|nr:hypothetical protein [Aeromonas jandaei]
MWIAGEGVVAQVWPSGTLPPLDDSLHSAAVNRRCGGRGWRYGGQSDLGNVPPNPVAK